MRGVILLFLMLCVGPRAVLASDRPLNATPLCGPESVAVSPAGEIYVSEAGSGQISHIARDGKVTPICNLQGTLGKRALPLGLTFDRKGDLYVAVQRIDGGCVVRLRKKSLPFVFGKPEVWRSGLGAANDVAINHSTGELYVSDSGPISTFGLVGGRVFRFPLAEETKRKAGKGDVLADLWFANGLAIDERSQVLYVSQTYRGPWGGRLSWLDLSRRDAEPQSIKLDGWPDAIEWRADNNSLAIALQKQGALAFYTPGKCKLLTLSLPSGMAPAGIARQGDSLVWTDFWNPNIIDIARGPIYHHHIYRKSIPR